MYQNQNLLATAQKISGLSTSNVISASDAATKGYVDNAIQSAGSGYNDIYTQNGIQFEQPTQKIVFNNTLDSGYGIGSADGKIIFIDDNQDSYGLANSLHIQAPALELGWGATSGTYFRYDYCLQFNGSSVLPGGTNYQTITIGSSYHPFKGIYAQELYLKSTSGTIVRLTLNDDGSIQFTNMDNSQASVYLNNVSIDDGVLS